MLRRMGLRPPERVGRYTPDGGPHRPHGLFRAGALLAVSLVAVVVITAGSAGTTTKPYTASFSTSVAGGSDVALTITNLANPQPLGSANITAASLNSSTAFTITGASPATAVDPTQTYPTSTLRLRNLNIPSGGSLTVHIAVNAPCTAGDYTWGIKAKQSNDFNGPPGNDFSLRTAGSNLVTHVAASCSLAWSTQPSNAVVNTLITGTPGDPGGPPVSVSVVDSSGQTVQSATGTVTLAKTAGTFTSNGGFSGTQANLVNGVATFSGFTSSATGSGLMVQASSPGYVSTPLAQGGPFAIVSNGADCVGLDPCNVSAPLANNTLVDASATGGAFTFLGLNNSTVPASVMQVGGGCQYLMPIGAGGFEETDNRTGTGELRFAYDVPLRLIQRSPNNGNPFVPLCAGAKRLVNNQPVDCNPNAHPGDPDGPWLGKALNPDGTFSGGLRYAVCGEGGFWWAIMGSFQDPIDPSQNPTITGWAGVTINGTSYRQFSLRVPNGWDWHVSP